MSRERRGHWRFGRLTGRKGWKNLGANRPLFDHMPRRCNATAGQVPPHVDFDVLEGFTKHRQWNTPISGDLMNDSETREIGRKIANCALHLKAQVILKPEMKPEVNLSHARLCNTRFCPFCEWRRTKALRARLYQGLTALYEDQPKLRGVFLTLTVKNVPIDRLGEQLQEMNRAWKRFTQCSFFPTALWFRRTEVTIGSGPMGQKHFSGGLADGGGQLYAHPHFHVLLLVRPSYFSHGYIKQLEWQQQWQMALRADYTPIVDVRTAKAKPGSHSASDGDAASAVVEAAKYAAKATQLMELGPAITELHWQLKNKRLVAMSKELAKFVKAGDITEKEMLAGESKPLPQGAERLEVMAQWFEDIEKIAPAGCR